MDCKSVIADLHCMSVRRELQLIDWNSVLETSSVEDPWLSLKTKLMGYSGQIKNKCSWMSLETKNLLK